MSALPSHIYEGMEKGELLIAAGEALYGGRWQTPIARDLGTTYRSVRNWQAGVHGYPADLEERLVALLRDRGLEIEAVLDRIGENEKENEAND